MAASIEMDGPRDTHVELGFVEEVESWKLTSKYFPSKVGGKPAWLRLKDLPTPDQLLCSTCQRPMVFLLQAYLPFEQWSHTFHRTVFVFFCRSAECYSTPNDSKNFRVFRSQLPRRNDFYDYEPPLENEAGQLVSASDFQPLCALCGCLGPKRCARCHTSYCSKEHQTLDWKAGHKTSCIGSDKVKPVGPSTSDHNLAEFEIVTEEEEEETDSDTERSEDERMNDYRALAEPSDEDYTNDDLEDLNAMASRQTDKQFQIFRKRIAREPQQVIRYQRGGQPLWVSVHHVPKNDNITPCECGSPRLFEFQILPQLLNHLKLDNIKVGETSNTGVDWGTLAIYTCSKSCELGDTAYHQEFVWKQDISS